MTELLKADASTYLAAVYKIVVPKQTNRLADFLIENAWVPVSDRAKVELVAVAVALVVVHGKSDSLRKLLIERRSNKRSTDLARVVIETLFANSDRSESMVRKLSAWATAARYLVGAQVAPSSIPALALNKGEGIDAWARKGAKRRVLANGRHHVVKPAILQPATVVIKIGKDRKKFSIGDSRVLAVVEEELVRLQSSYPGPEKT